MHLAVRWQMCPWGPHTAFPVPLHSSKGSMFAEHSEDDICILLPIQASSAPGGEGQQSQPQRGRSVLTSRGLPSSGTVLGVSAGRARSGHQTLERAGFLALAPAAESRGGGWAWHLVWTPTILAKALGRGGSRELCCLNSMVFRDSKWLHWRPELFL